MAGLTGLGSTTEQWDAAHQENSFFNNGQVYGDDPSLPDYLANHGAVYFGVQFIGDTVYGYSLNMHTLDKTAAIARAQQELPDDAVQTWEIPLSGCVRVAFTSQKLKEALGSPTVNVDLADIQSDGSSHPSPTEFNQEQFASGGLASATPNPDFGC
ncbi:hypothetical protein GPOL_c12620 [Gordonia polyisoprenivorans VH2]|uniref:Uncharacterized protein n=1 Tax=Gordonia polyisoprenivorans (strain DSM 44266 / VH2) TaxID=1112204 RepID=H6N3F8_GORPV|nr:hypothetical protein [Gordonia polyisoprenivorans]AFA72317.1 hypothetical protein GPOL_c12620 [Gordonia polyisoprenivorans VH2]